MDRKIVNIFLAFIVSIIAFFLFEILFKNISIDRVYNFFENCLFACLIIMISFFINGLWFKKFYLIIGFVIFISCLFIETFYYFHFENEVCLCEIHKVHYIN